ncbi:MAG: group I truncated hemoglobin [Thermodesulfobacteriota bacterium]
MKLTLLRRSTTTSLIIILFLLLSLPAVIADEAKEDSVETEKSLYLRLGGYGAISLVVNDFAEKLFVDPQVGPFFKGMGTDTRKSFIQKNINLVCNVTGGPCKVISRPAKTIHAGLGITESDFNVVVDHLVDTLNKFNVPTAEKEELLAIIGTLKPDIVESGVPNPPIKKSK